MGWGDGAKSQDLNSNFSLSVHDRYFDFKVVSGPRCLGDLTIQLICVLATKKKSLCYILLLINTCIQVHVPRLHFPKSECNWLRYVIFIIKCSSMVIRFQAIWLVQWSLVISSYSSDWLYMENAGKLNLFSNKYLPVKNNLNSLLLLNPCSH